MESVRIECPNCGTSYRADVLNLKANPGEKAFVRCIGCGHALEVTFSEQRYGWFDWRKRVVANAERE